MSNSIKIPRKINQQLESWKDERGRKPLLLRGARQVGKSHSVREFGFSHFQRVVEVNFELEPGLSKIFEASLDPFKITRDLALSLNQPIETGTTLLFLDEVQACPSAISSLRYFYEKMPGLHVIAAGSLLEFALESEKLSMPVGRIQSIFLHPVSFLEFLKAKGEDLFVEYITEQSSLLEPPEETLHKKGLALVKEYAVVGGMPDSIVSYLPEPQSLKYRRTQQGLLQTFRDDFGKYARSAKHQYLDKVFLSAPALISRDYKYTKVDRDLPGRSIKDALLLLEKAGILLRIRASSGAGLPLEAGASDRRFKIAFLDIGLTQAALGLDAEIALSEDFIAVNSGAIAEQFVAQELIAKSSPFEPARLYYWVRTKRGSSAEVDLLYQHGSNVFPLEVKAGATGKLKSLRSFLDSHKVPFGIRVSAHQLGLTGGVLSVPFYLLPAIDRLLDLK